jgi:hypothetical protein
MIGHRSFLSSLTDRELWNFERSELIEKGGIQHEHILGNGPGNCLRDNPAKAKA